MLQAARGLMFAKGYQPSGAHKHLSVELFLESTQGDSDLIVTFDRLGKKRNQVVYEEPNIVTAEEAEYALGKAIEFVELAEGELQM